MRLENLGNGRHYAGPMIPKLLHFCYFSSPEANADFPLVYFFAVRSAIHHIRPDRTYVHCVAPPRGLWWEQLRNLVQEVPCDLPTEIFGRTLYHPAHRSDVRRLRVLQEQGGIYLDLDTITVRSFDPLLSHSCVMGRQSSTYGDGLCNAVILCEPGSEFVAAWIQEYHHFRSKGRDEFWDELSVRTPLRLAREFSARAPARPAIHIEPPASFFQPGFEPQELKGLFERDLPHPEAYCHHLWWNYAFDRYLRALTPELIRTVDTTYNRLARPYLPAS